MMGKRRWLGLRGWIADADGEMQNETLWWTDRDQRVDSRGRPARSPGTPKDGGRDALGVRGGRQDVTANARERYQCCANSS
jgi:hypothetical protein